MDMGKKIKLAMAVGDDGNFQAKHFGDADKYEIYEWDNNSFFYLNEIINPFKTLDEEQEHGSREKGKAIIGLLKENNINILVSKQFGKNIQMVIQHFIPVIVSKNTPGEVLEILDKQIKWIEDELKNKPDEFSLFTINKGILKTKIKKS